MLPMCFRNEALSLLEESLHQWVTLGIGRGGTDWNSQTCVWQTGKLDLNGTLLLHQGTPSTPFTQSSYTYSTPLQSSCLILSGN